MSTSRLPVSKYNNLPCSAARLTCSRTVSLGKFGTFKTNQIIGRPYHVTFDIVDGPTSSAGSVLRLVPAAELHRETLQEEEEADEGGEASAVDEDGVEYQRNADTGDIEVRTNRTINDNNGSQTLTGDEIETLKSDTSLTAKEIITRIMKSHSAIDQKTAFSLAKYIVRKRRKYLKRFTVLPLDVATLTEYLMSEKEPQKILEMREEMLALAGCWGNVHFSEADVPGSNGSDIGQGRWLVVDETGGLLVAAMAERMGMLHPPESLDSSSDESATDAAAPPTTNGFSEHDSLPARHVHAQGMTASSNTLTLIHHNSQPNLSLLNYFQYDVNNPTPSHPLFSNLKTLSWLQLLNPSADSSYTQPETISEEVLASYKASKRGTYYRKHRRWERIKSVIDETRTGDFDGIVIASYMDPITILQNTLPLLAGSAQVVIYSPSVEPLVEVVDCLSTLRKAAFLNSGLDTTDLPTEDFPLDPTMLLTPTIQTARVRQWQVLPGRTHPKMAGRGGAEGYIFHATRVLPAEGKVEGRGVNKKRKVTKDDSVDTPMEVVDGET